MILPMMTLHVFVQVVAIFESTKTQSTMVCNLSLAKPITVIHIISSMNLQCVPLGGLKRWYPLHTGQKGINSPQHDFLCASFCGFLRGIPCHTEHSDMDFPQHDSSCVVLCGSRI